MPRQKDAPGNDNVFMSWIFHNLIGMTNNPTVVVELTAKVLGGHRLEVFGYKCFSTLGCFLYFSTISHIPAQRIKTTEGK
jgi:hypothetical protein